MHRFLQLHSLASYPGTLLNRDDAGMAKRLPFGGTVRTRVSSQALKRRWRFAGQENHEAAAQVPFSLQSVGLPMGERSKEVVERQVLPVALQGRSPPHEDTLATLRDKLLAVLYGDKGVDIDKRQALFFGQPELEYLAQVAGGLLAGAPKGQPDKAALKAWGKQLDDELKPLRDNLLALARGAGLESALWGRMVTSDPRANRDACVHVAHAFTVHPIERELDYVTAVDDLRRRDRDAGSAGIFDAELTSGLYYVYLCVDLALLRSNLAGDAAMAGTVLERLIQLVARVSPGAKKGSTAPHSHAEWLLAELCDDQPRSLANAFRDAVPLEGGNLFRRSMEALQHHLDDLDAGYGAVAQRAQLSVTRPALRDVPALRLDELAAWVKQQVDKD
jgi:CRISPR system Cascade subunit CasC